MKTRTSRSGASPGRPVAPSAAGHFGLGRRGVQNPSAWRPKRARASSTLRWFLFFLFHVPLVVAIKASAITATIHALITFAAGIRSLRSRTPERVLYVMGYIVASEPLWRVGRAMIFYESGKFAIAALSILAIYRYRLIVRSDKTAWLYFLLLLPSLAVMEEFDRRQISFNLSGPFALATCTLFLSALRLSAYELKRLSLVTLAPIMGLAGIATFSTVTTENINFYTSKIAAGGLGNNQASSIFGLGLLLAFLFLFIERHDKSLRWLVAASGVWCGAQAALTFSRGGVATAIGAIAVASFFLLRDRRTRGALVVRMGLLVLLAGYVVVPQLDLLTGGALATRFSSSHLTGRDKIIEADLMAFRENPVLGVGPGGAKGYHIRTFRWSSAHTEYSRLLAEHGIFGLVALLLLFWMVVRRSSRPLALTSKAFSAAFSVWALLFMFHAAMRMAASSFIFALGTAYLLAEVEAPLRSRRRRSRAAPLPPRPSVRIPVSHVSAVSERPP